jgi:hypothetical protein
MCVCVCRLHLTTKARITSPDWIQRQRVTEDRKIDLVRTYVQTYLHGVPDKFIRLISTVLKNCIVFSVIH